MPNNKTTSNQNINRMISQEIFNRYLTGDRLAVKKMSKSQPLTSKEEFYNILKAWKIVVSRDGLEDVQIGQEEFGPAPVLWLTLGGKKYYLNGDTRLHGVREFLKNKDNPWVVIANQNGKRNKVVNTPDHQPTEGFFLYLEE